MDYNSRPWVYEVVGIMENGERRSYYSAFEKNAKECYEGWKEAHIVKDDVASGKRFKTVLFCHSRKGTLKGSIEPD